MFRFLFQLDDTLFSTLTMNSLKNFKVKKMLNIIFLAKYNFFIATHIIDSNFEEI